MKTIADLLIAAIALTTPVWTVWAVTRLICWQENRKQTHLIVHRHKDGSLKALQFNEGKTPRMLISH